MKMVEPVMYFRLWIACLLLHYVRQWLLILITDGINNNNMTALENHYQVVI